MSNPAYKLSVALNFPGNLPLILVFLFLFLSSLKNNQLLGFSSPAARSVWVQKGGWEWAGWTGSPLGLGVRAWETGDSHSWGAEGKGRGSIYTQQAGKNSSNPLCLALKQKQGCKYVCKLYYIFDREFLYRAKVPAPEIWGVKWSSGSANQLAKLTMSSLSHDYPVWPLRPFQLWPSRISMNLQIQKGNEVKDEANLISPRL